MTTYLCINHITLIKLKMIEDIASSHIDCDDCVVLRASQPILSGMISKI